MHAYGSAPLIAVLRSRLLQALVVFAAVAGMIEGCAGPRILESAVPMASPVEARPSCTAQWLAHGHTNQPEAQAFAKKCLEAQGVVARQFDDKAIARKMTALIDADHPLTALEPSDIGEFCPGYLSQDREGRAIFWRTLLAALVHAESVNNSAAAFWEEDQGQYSIGLMQLSLADEPRYKCGFKSEAEITDPDRNLVCGIKVVTMLVSADGAIGGGVGHEMKGAAAYWQNLRQPLPARMQLINATKAVAMCKGDGRSS